jgi:hypothetical protein
MEEVQAFEVDQKVGQASGDPKKVGEQKKVHKINDKKMVSIGNTQLSY